MLAGVSTFGGCPDSETSLGGDCDDNDGSVFPGALDLPDDGFDQDCDDVDATVCFYDGDLDGFGSSGVVLAPDGDCDDLGESSVGTDCDDDAGWIHPGGVEITGNGFDEDCSGSDTVSCFVDADSDGDGGPTVVLDGSGTCAAVGLAATSGDCDDSDILVGPSALDVPGDGLDQDCNGVDAAVCFYDGDSDGFGLAQPDHR